MEDSSSDGGGNLTPERLQKNRESLKDDGKTKVNDFFLYTGVLRRLIVNVNTLNPPCI